MGGVNIPLPELDVTKPAPAPYPDALSEFQRASQLQTAAAQREQMAAQTQGLQQQNQAQALQLKDEQMRRQLAPQYVQKDENGKVTGFDTEGLYNAMLQGGADPASIAQMKMKQVEYQKSLIGLSDEQLSHQDKVNGALFNSLESVRNAYKQADPTLGAKPAPQSPSNDPNAPVPGTGGMPGFMLPNVQQAPAEKAPAVPPEAQAAYQKELINLAHQGIPIQNLKPVLTSYQDLDQAEAELGLHKQVMADAKEQAATAESAGKAKEAEAKAQAELWKPAGEGTLMNVSTGQLIHGVASPDVEAFRAYIEKGGTPEQWPAWKARQTSEAEAPVRIATAQAEGQARASIEAQVARGSNAALAQVPIHLVAPATQAATKAAEDYAQAHSVSDRLAAMMDDAKKGNVVSYQLLPQEGALQLTTSQGIHRINMAEIQNYGGGSLWQKMEGHIGKALTGESIPASVLDDMAEMQKIQERGSIEKYNNSLKSINQNYGSNFKPVEMENKVGGGTQGSSGKAVSLAAAKQLPQNKGKSDAEIEADIKAHGHEVRP